MFALGDGSYESVAHSVSHYNGTEGSPPVSQCDCVKNGNPCSNSNWFYTFASTFNTEMLAMGYDQHAFWQNIAVDPADIVDPSRHGYGADSVDPYGTDFADVVFTSSHGNHECGPDYQSRFAVGQTHANQTCWPETDDDVKWGDVDTNVAILFGCESVQKCVWQNGGYNPMSAGDMDVLLGFHGTMWLSSSTDDRLADYLADSHTQDIGDYWVDYLTDLQTFPWENPDQCATAVLWGASSAEMDEAYNHAGYLDFHDTGAHLYTAFYYWDGCDPEEGEEL